MKIMLEGAMETIKMSLREEKDQQFDGRRMREMKELRIRQ